MAVLHPPLGITERGTSSRLGQGIKPRLHWENNRAFHIHYRWFKTDIFCSVQRQNLALKHCLKPDSPAKAKLEARF